MWYSWKLWVLWCCIIALIGLLGFGFTRDPKKVPSPLLGNTAPDFELISLGGEKKIRLEELKGKPVLLNFWASWCQECKLEARILENFYEKYGSSSKLINFVGIAIQDTPSKAKNFAKIFGKTYFLGLDDKSGNLALEYGIYGVPETFFIDSEGKIFYKHIGVVTTELLEKKFKPFL